jgi:predicted small secreted protein
MSGLPRTRAVFPAAFLAALLLAGCGRMTAGELSPSVDTLVSSAAEGQLMARDVARDRTKTTFVRAHARELGEDVDHEAEKLNDATPAPGVGPRRDAASKLADEISTALGQLQTGPDDRAGARQTEAQLARLAKQAERLAASL